MNSQFESSTRRLSNSCLIRHFYTAVKVINCQRQAANAVRICKYMQRNHELKPADCIAELELCVRDGLLHVEHTMGKKGSKKGAMQERYVVPSILKRDGHDWYCFECHKGGEVICCSSCHRVFHTYCIKSLSQERYLCCVCRIENKSIPITKEKLNRLLCYLCKSIKDLVPSKFKKWKNLELDELVMRALVYKPIDVQTMQQKTLDLEYNNWMEFATDAKNIYHNVVICFGERNTFTQQTSKMIDYCLHDVQEIEKCADCYEASNDRTDRHWFCKPCKPLHTLVFAKLESSPFWPAKVITKFGNEYDVRFFGSGHTRSVIPKAHVIQIPPSIKHIENLPKYGNTSSWEKAVSELIFHIICIGPQIILKRLPNDYNAKKLLQAASLNPQRTTKRKITEDNFKHKKMRCEDIGGNKKKKVYKMCDKLVRKILRCDKERCDNNIVNNINCDEAISEQQVVVKDVPNFQSHTNTTVQETEMQEINIPEKTDSMNLASHSELDSDSVSLSELHEEIDIKDEYVEEQENQIDDDYDNDDHDQVQTGNVIGTNVRSKTNSEQCVEGSSSCHAISGSNEQQTEIHKLDDPKKSDSLAVACQPDSVLGKVFNNERAIKKENIHQCQHNNSNEMGGSIQKFQNILNNCGNSSEDNSRSSKSDSECLQVLAESIIVKEEPLCLQCSSLDMITRKEAEEMKDEAVAQTTKHFVAIIARMQEQFAQNVTEKKKSSGHKD